MPERAFSPVASDESFAPDGSKADDSDGGSIDTDNAGRPEDDMKKSIPA
jgi:hypothetical protein